MERVNSHIEVSVIDSGQGMSADFLAACLRAIPPIEVRPHSRETGGLGLGLALVKYLVEMHGGIHRGSQRRRGSRLDIRREAAVAVVEQAEGAERIHPRSAVVRGTA